MGTFCVGIFILVIVGLVVRSMVMDRKNGKSCGGSCASCKGCGHHSSDNSSVS